LWQQVNDCGIYRAAEKAYCDIYEAFAESCGTGSYRFFYYVDGGKNVDERMEEIKHVLWIVLLLNVVVAVGKILLGFFTKSNSILADGFHSIADSTSNIIGLVGIAAAMLPVDRDHPYGHKKFETMAALGIAGLLGVTVLTILHEAYERFLNPVVPEVNQYSFLVMTVTMAINIMVVRYEKKQGVVLQSDILLSDSYHTATDILVSLSVILTLVAVKLGWFWMDTVAAIIIAGLIAVAAWKIVKHGSMVLCDQAVLDEEAIIGLAMEVEGVQGCHKVRSRGRRDDLQIDLHIQVDNAATIEEAHQIGHCVADAVRKEYEGVADVVVHVEPYNLKRIQEEYTS
jgi:cation diffusion facilitator family transporter